MPKQLTLPFTIHDDATFANYYPGQNTQLLKYLQNNVFNNCETVLYLWGKEGVGRSHLLQACCHASDQFQKQMVYLPLSQHRKITPDILIDLEQVDWVAIDDIDQVMGDRNWEEALFHFYNRAITHQTQLMIAASCLPTQLSCQLPDLQSRLANSLVFEVKALNDKELLQAIQLRAEKRSMQLPSEVGIYLLHHYPRNMKTLMELLTQLDQASLTAQRRLTIPFVKQVLLV